MTDINKLVRVTHPTDRPNFYVVELGDLSVWFSYRTPIAFQYGWADRVVRRNDWGPTTGKHLNMVDDGEPADKAARLDGPQFEAALQAVLIQAGLLGGVKVAADGS